MKRLAALGSWYAIIMQLLPLFDSSVSINFGKIISILYTTLPDTKALTRFNFLNRNTQHFLGGGATYAAMSLI